MVGKAGSGGGMGNGDTYYKTDKKTKKLSELRKLIHLNYIFNTDSKLMDSEVMKVVEKKNLNSKRKIANPILRFMFSLQEGEEMSEEKWIEFVYDFGRELGVDLEYHQMAIYLHTDTANQHIHVQINRVDLSATEIISDSNIGRKTEKIIEKLRARYHFKENPQVISAIKDDVRREGRSEANEYVRSILKKLLTGKELANISSKGSLKVDLLSLNLVLKKYGIASKYKFDSNNKFVGVSFQYQNETFSGQKVGWKAEQLAKGVNDLNKAHESTKKQLCQVLAKSYNENKEDLGSMKKAFKLSGISFSVQKPQSLKADFSRNMLALIQLVKKGYPAKSDELLEESEQVAIAEELAALLRAENELIIHFAGASFTITELVAGLFNPNQLDTLAEDSLIANLFSVARGMAFEKEMLSQSPGLAWKAEPVQAVSPAVITEAPLGNNQATNIEESGAGRHQIYTDDEKMRDEALAKKKAAIQRGGMSR
jgi:Relaxase/Mobilisation nuclease domain